MVKVAEKTQLNLWDRHTFTYGPARITVERRTVKHMMIRDRVALMLPDGDGVDNYWRNIYSQVVVQTVAIEGVELALPSPSAGPEEIRAGYERFLQLDGNLLDAWFLALKHVDRAPGDQVFWPPYLLSEDERKNLHSAAGSGGASSGSSSAP
jgi:hypothetical protein